jgi:two-component system chemotaxis response regulator CheB
MIVIGASLGGTAALRGVVSRLPADFPLPLAATLHRHRESNDLLVEVLQHTCPFPVREVRDKDPIQPRCLFVAPADYHLMVEPDHFSLSIDEPVSYARPSIDVLFESAADAFAARAIAVVLTGANQDGARGAAAIRRRGGIVIVQDPATAESAVMPAAAIETAGANYICQIEEIAGLLVRLAALAESQRS